MLLSKMRVRLPVIATPYFVHNGLPWIPEEWPKAVNHGFDTRLFGDYIAHCGLRWAKTLSQLTMFEFIPVVQRASQCIDGEVMDANGSHGNILNGPRQFKEAVKQGSNRRCVPPNRHTNHLSSI